MRELFRHWTGHRSFMCRARRSGYYAWNVLGSNANWRIQEINSQMNPPHQFSGSGNWHELVRPHTCHETMHNQATLTDRAAMRRYDRPPPALSTPVLADSRVQKRGQRPGICALPLLARWTGLVQRTNTCTSRCEFYWLLNVGVRFERRVPVVNVSYMDVSMYVLFSRLTSNGIPVEKPTILGGKICLYICIRLGENYFRF